MRFAEYQDAAVQTDQAPDSLPHVRYLQSLGQ